MDNEAPVPQAAPLPAEIFLAGFWVRAGAFLIDAVILALCSFLPPRGLSFLVGLAYKTIFISQGGQTPGKMAAGIKVVNASTGEPVGVGRALGRAAAEHLSALTLGLGYLAAALADKRALHDYIAGTRVIYVEGISQGRKTAFAILGVLALILPMAAVGYMAVIGGPRIKTLARRAGEGSTKAHLGSMRAAASIYYGKTEGTYPAALEALVGPDYLKTIAQTKLGDHPATDVRTAYGAEVCAGKDGRDIDASKIKDTGGWGYVSDPKASCWGHVFVDCAHKDSKGKPWPEY